MPIPAADYYAVGSILDGQDDASVEASWSTSRRLSGRQELAPCYL